jgi:electron transfer flavoprotein alpha subunit
MGDSWSFGKNLASTHSIKKSIGIIYEAIALDIQHTSKKYRPRLGDNIQGHEKTQNLKASETLFAQVASMACKDRALPVTILIYLSVYL